MFALILVAFLQTGPQMAVEVFPTLQACQAERERAQAALQGATTDYVLECGLIRSVRVSG